MDALELLTTRRSNKKLVAPAPNKEQLEQIFQAALRTPDHGKLKPYRFVVIADKGLIKLANALTQVATDLNLDNKQFSKIDKICASPMVIAVVAKLDPKVDKVPEWEQLVAAGCATYGIQLAAQSLGFDNVWITGKWAGGDALRQTLNCTEQEKIVALLLIGTAENEKLERDSKTADTQDFVSYL
ncbi:nitroreductase [Lonepinella koalarum]|uniref:Putative NAD(P)H nitroreductase n=1 Tax=Lonepinella koalarum TaxID=53417 RepID=A0A4R1KXX0_9PAST|nr:nitroreductase family protein [Lonepinella koalarum]MDH2927036.1 nitroreductase [Lonepinella koalarum]TCK70305.1 nitroreductase [Lonepinella koalarum]TFJ89304.1 nitroreductase [Lonepinella koalarum]TYG33597.1 nitroreductase [Lonepinella koalarum]